MARITNTTGGEMNIGQSFGACDAGPKLWSTQRYAAYGTMIQFRVRDVSRADGGSWYRAYFRLGLANAAGTEYAAATATKVWGAFSPWVQVTSAWYLGNFRLVTSCGIHLNSAGQPLSCRWGSFSIDVNYDNTH